MSTVDVLSVFALVGFVGLLTMFVHWLSRAPTVDPLEWVRVTCPVCATEWAWRTRTFAIVSDDRKVSPIACEKCGAHLGAEIEATDAIVALRARRDEETALRARAAEYNAQIAKESP